MGNPFVEALYNFKAPEEDFVNEESIGDLVQLCPAVSRIMSDSQQGTINPIHRGFLSTMGIVYDMIVGSGLEECLTGITYPFMERIDKLVVGGKFSLIRDNKPLVPAVLDIMKEKASPFQGGILLALACVVKRAEEDYGPADTVVGYPAPTESLPDPVTVPTPPPAPEQPKPEAPRTRPSMSRPDDITRVLSDLHSMGIPLENVSLRPEKTETGLKLNIAIQMNDNVSFENIAKINVIGMAVLNKPVELRSSSGIWARLSL